MQDGEEDEDDSDSGPDDGPDDLEFNALSLTIEGNCGLGRMQKLCKAIVNKCTRVPPHVSDIARLAQSQPSHLKRDLHV